MISLCHNDYCWPMVDVVSTRTPKSFSTFHPVSPQQVLVLGLFSSRYKTLYFPLLNFRMPLLAHFSSQIPLVYQLLPSLLSNQQTRWGYALPHHPNHIEQNVHSTTPLDTLLATGLHNDFVAQKSIWLILHPACGGQLYWSPGEKYHLLSPFLPSQSIS